MNIYPIIVPTLADLLAMPVHPLADRFPLMPDAEMAELAESIRSVGLLHPIIISDGLLIDGRNRLRACEMAGVDPRCEPLSGNDAVDYILAVNVARRHLTTGQRAMAMALAYPEKEKGGRGKKLLSSEGFSDVNSGRLSDARSILEHDDLVETVLAGTKRLDTAKKEADARRHARETEQNHLIQLRAEAADLADMVADGQLELEEAQAALSKRKAMERERRESAIQIVYQFQMALGTLSADSFSGFIAAALADPEFKAEFVRRIPAIDAGRAVVGFDQFQALMEACHGSGN